VHTKIQMNRSIALAYRSQTNRTDANRRQQINRTDKPDGQTDKPDEPDRQTGQTNRTDRHQISDTSFFLLQFLRPSGPKRVEKKFQLNLTINNFGDYCNICSAELRAYNYY